MDSFLCFLFLSLSVFLKGYKCSGRYDPPVVVVPAPFPSFVIPTCVSDISHSSPCLQRSVLQRTPTPRAASSTRSSPLTANSRPVFLVICRFDLTNELSVYVVGLCRGGRGARGQHLCGSCGRNGAYMERQTRSFAQDLVLTEGFCHRSDFGAHFFFLFHLDSFCNVCVQGLIVT